MKYLRLTAVILLLLYTEVQGRVETVRCEFVYHPCNIRLVEDSEQPITALIFEIPNRSVVELQITGGKLESIPDLSDAISKFTTIQKITLRNVGLKVLNGTNLGKALERITTLLIEQNEISHLDDDAFKKLHNLERISLGKNSLETLPASIFNNNKELTVIYINHNKLKEIHDDTFKELERLVRVDMSFNQLETLPANIFRDNKGIVSLSLSANKIKEIHSDTFKELRHLRLLYLGFNQLETLSSTIFRNNGELFHIFLQNNKLKAIDRDTFKGLNLLRALVLNDNQIAILPRGLFDENSSLSLVKLHNNTLIRIETNLQNLQYLKGLTLTGNFCIDQSCSGSTCNSTLLNELRDKTKEKCSNREE